MKLLTLTQGKFAQVDDEDYEWLSQWKWYYSGEYAVRNSSKLLGKRKILYMHREIMQAAVGVEIDHADMDTLNNQRHNLRVSTHAQNQENGRIYKTNTSGYKGVSWHKRDKVWSAAISVDNRQVFLGNFVNKEDAVKAYNAAALKFHGEFARINIL